MKPLLRAVARFFRWLREPDYPWAAREPSVPPAPDNLPGLNTEDLAACEAILARGKARRRNTH